MMRPGSNRGAPSSPEIGRRGFLSSLAAPAVLSSGALGQANPQASRVTSDVGSLRRVLVHTPGAEVRRALALAAPDQAMLPPDLIRDEIVEQHHGFTEALRRAGAEPIEFVPQLQAAIDAARREGAFRAWLEESAPQLLPMEEEVTASALIGAEDRFFYRTDARGRLRPLVDPMIWLCFVRDLGAMTPRGFVLGHFIYPQREFEIHLARLAFRFAPQLREIPLAFDAQAEGVFLQGGDVIVANETTLWLGVGNMTDPEAAPKLAQSLEMEVVSVRMPGAPSGRRSDRVTLDPWSGLRREFLHLDSILNLVDEKSVIALPELLHQRTAGRDPLTQVLRGLREDHRAKTRYIDWLIASLETVGRVEIYEAGSGRRLENEKPTKILDLLSERGYRLLPVGGDPRPGSVPVKHWFEGVMRELHQQAANVVATSPGRIIAFDGNAGTLDLMRAQGLAVSTLSAPELGRWSGGPHCLSLPLERG